MKIALFLLCLVIVTHASHVLAGPWDLNIQQYDAGGFGLINRLTVQPAGGAPGVVVYDTSTSPVLPKIATLSGMTLSGGVLSVTGSAPAWSALTGTPPPVSTFANDASYATTSALALKYDTPTGLTTQYVRGNGTLASFPTAISTFTNDSAYITQAQARSAISLTTTGVGAATYNNSTGVLNVPTPTLTINDNPGRSLVTSTAAMGYQVSATRPSRVCYEGSFSTTSSIGGPSSASVFLETSTTNSTTPSDWTTKASQTYSNNITLAVTLNQAQGNNWSMCRDIAAALFVRLRSGAITGTASASLNATQQETTY